MLRSGRWTQEELGGGDDVNAELYTKLPIK